MLLVKIMKKLRNIKIREPGIDKQRLELRDGLGGHPGFSAARRKPLRDWCSRSRRLASELAMRTILVRAREEFSWTPGTATGVANAIGRWDMKISPIKWLKNGLAAVGSYGFGNCKRFQVRLNNQCASTRFRRRRWCRKGHCLRRDENRDGQPHLRFRWYQVALAAHRTQKDTWGRVFELAA